MAFEYGSQSIEIRNPFRLEGFIYLLRGLAVAALGIYLILYVGGDAPAGVRDMQFGVGVLLAAIGLYAVGLGLYKMARFYVGRGVPANLSRAESSAPSITPGSAGAFPHQGIYDPPEVLSEMLVGRKNVTFREPRGWLARMQNGLAFSQIFLPHPMRWITLKLFMATWYSLVVLVLLGLTLLYARTTGWTEVTETPVLSYLGVAALIAILAVWMRFQPTPLWRNSDLRSPRTYSSRTSFADRPFKQFLKMAIWLGAPVLLIWQLVEYQQSTGLDPLPLSPFPWLVGVALSIFVAFVYALVMAVRRAPRGTVPTEVSEYRDHWQESVHPMDIFRAIEMTLANHRYMEIPNREYLKEEPNLLGQGSENKGDFKGETLHEIQPAPLTPKPRDMLILPGVLLGQALMLGSSIWLFMAVQAAAAPSLALIDTVLLGPLLLWLLGGTLTYVANIYLGEVHFESQLIAFRASGTYSESRLATGMSIHDSTRSENTFVRSSLTPWLVVSHIHSSIIAVSGAMNLEQPRYVLAMERNDALTEELVADIRRYLRERQVMAGVQSESDLKAASSIHQMNEQTRALRDPTLPELPLSEELRREQLGHGPSEKD